MTRPVRLEVPSWLACLRERGRSETGEGALAPDLHTLPPAQPAAYLPAMSASPGGRRAKALLLLLVLLVGGFGLPVTDAIVFHSTAGAPVSTQEVVSAGHEAGPAHLLGCAVWSSPAASTGLPGMPPAPVAILLPSPERPTLCLAVLTTQTSHTLAFPRAPPTV
jgi:hypothetical protein